MKLLAKYIICSSLIILAFQSCKKGEDDPFFSLRTRKNRASGSWTLKSGYLDVRIERAGSVSDEHYEFSETDLSYTELNTGKVENGISHHLKLELDKKGHFTIDEESYGVAFKADGEWDFEDGTGKGKNKEYLQLKITSVRQGKLLYYDGFNKSTSNFAYRIKELRNKKLVLVSDKNMVYDYASGDKLWIESEYEFTQ